MSFFVIKPELKRLNLKNPLHLLAVGLGSGLCPKAPGTMGTLVAVVLYLLVSGLPTLWFIGLLVVGFVVGIRICQSATDAIGMPDHGAIVWDEVIGFGVTMIAA
ncbi:MAG: phosphatidylglycerophosphatase A family protein, partial [Aeromonas sp.]